MLPRPETGGVSESSCHGNAHRGDPIIEKLAGLLNAHGQEKDLHELIDFIADSTHTRVDVIRSQIAADDAGTIHLITSVDRELLKISKPGKSFASLAGILKRSRKPLLEVVTLLSQGVPHREIMYDKRINEDIEAAKAILMNNFQCSEPHAYNLLQTAAMTFRQTLPEAALIALGRKTVELSPPTLGIKTLSKTTLFSYLLAKNIRSLKNT